MHLDLSASAGKRDGGLIYLEMLIMVRNFGVLTLSEQCGPLKLQKDANEQANRHRIADNKARSAA